MGIAGIDLAGSERRDTGYCFLDRRKARVAILHSDDEILARIRADKPRIIAIDAPLSLPRGRQSLEKNNGVHFRQCDLELRKRGIRFFPITLGPMRMLTKRGMGLKDKIKGIFPESRVIEVYPGATYDILGAGRKDRAAILSLFAGYALYFDPRDEGTKSQDGLDSACAALTAALFAKGKAEKIGDKREGLMIIPRIKKIE